MRTATNAIRKALTTTGLCACLAMFGCGDDQTVPNDAVGIPDSTASNADGAPKGEPYRHAEWVPSSDPSRIVAHGLQFAKPVTWIETQPITSLRSLNYTIPGTAKTSKSPGGDSAELALFYMEPGVAMDVEEHINRWVQQFEPDENGNRPAPERMTITAADQDIPVVELRGSYVKSGSAWFTPGQLMIAAILETPAPAESERSGQLIIRLAGPEATVDANRETFLDLLRSAKAVEKADSPDVEQ